MKKVGSKIYIHVSAMGQLPSDMQAAVATAMKLLPGPDHKDVDFKFNVVKVSADKKEVSFLWSPRFDEEDEPAVICSMHTKDGKVTFRKENEKNPPIYHGKHLFVNEDYSGFDVPMARARYESWKKVESPLLSITMIGRKQYWEGIALPELRRRGIAI